LRVADEKPKIGTLTEITDTMGGIKNKILIMVWLI
jgi:hypothetical protein